MKKVIAMFLLTCLMMAFTVTAFAGNGYYNGTVNGKPFSMTYSCSKSTATCYISCPTAQNVEARIFVQFKMGSGNYSDSISAYSEPGTVATAVWNAGTGRTITGSSVSGYVNNNWVYGTIVNP